MAVGVFELDNLVACFVALDAASKAANVRIQSVERNRLKSGACVKMRGSVSDVNAAMEVALEAADMALAGITSKIPVDQVIDAMKEVGDKMDVSLRETGVGGVAGTPAAQEVVEKLGM